MGKLKAKPWNKIISNVKEKLDKTSIRHWALAAAILFVLYGVLVINISPMGYELQVGEVIRYDIRVPRDMENRAATERQQNTAAERAEIEALDDPNNWKINHATGIAVNETVTEIMQFLEKNRVSLMNNDNEIVAENELVADQEEIKVDLLDLETYATQTQRQLAQDWELVLPNEDVRQLLQVESAEFDLFQETVTTIVAELMSNRISVDELGQVINELGVKITQSPINPSLDLAAHEIGSQVIRPNLVLSQEQVEQQRAEAIRSIEPVTVKAGEIIISDGTVIQPEHIQLLQDLGLYRDGLDYRAFLGLFIIVVLLLVWFSLSLYKYQTDAIESENKLALIGSVLILVTIIGKLLSFMEWNLITYLTPIALAGMLITMLLDSRASFLTVTILAILSGIMHQSLPFVIMGLIGGLIAILTVSQVSQRGELMRAGFIVGASNFLVMVSFGLLLNDTSLLIHSYLGMLNGVISSVIAIGTLPYFESVFNITSAIRLLELSNPNNPLLRRLLMETPGTYHHSILVGNLAEAAAEAVGADGLLARVGSTFHDIGKLKRPYFFAENQLGMENPHDKIAPSLSTLIITSHVRDGLEIAREYKLPAIISAFIAQHHGSDLVKFFYHRAAENGGETIEESDFRYPGPKPQTKETAIVSLADPVEAAVRALSKPSPSKIEGLVRKIIRERLDDGQLDESDLTFKDLNKIADAFTKVLNGIFHARVQYPEKITREEIEGKNRS